LNFDVAVKMFQKCSYNKSLLCLIIIFIKGIVAVNLKIV
jgi:hypothetical protein